MAKCMYCHHCGNCGPGSLADNSVKRGTCLFCGCKNPKEAKVCAQCGKILPLPPGSVKE